MLLRRIATPAGRCRSSTRLGKKFVDAIGAAQTGARIPRDASQGQSDDSHPTSTSAQSSRGLLWVGDFGTTILTGGRDLRESAARCSYAISEWRLFTRDTAYFASRFINF